MKINANDPNLSSAQQVAEQGYINQLTAAVQATYANKAALQLALNNIMMARSIDPLLAGQSHIVGRNSFEMQPQEIQTTFDRIIPDYENLVDQWLPGIPASNERLALVSLAYNNLIGFNADGSFKSGKLRQAIITDNRAEAWFEIRYHSNADGQHTGRRIDESKLFGLYDNAGLGVGEAEAKEVLRMYTTHRDAILAYESRFSTQFAASGTNTIQFQLTSAATTLIDIYAFAKGYTITGEVLVGADDLIPGETLTGTTQSDLIFGENGHDTLKGEAGDDVLYGGEGTDTLIGGTENDYLDGGGGYDTYVYRINDGQDTISDSDGKGSLFYDGQLVAGGIRRDGDPEHTYRSLDGTFTFVQSGTDLLVNNLITIKNYTPGSGALGITLRDLSTLPDGTPPVIDYNNGYDTEIFLLQPGPVEFNGSSQWILQGDGPTNYVVQGNYGPEIIHGDNEIFTTAYAQNQQFAGGDGSDEITGDFQDRLYGEVGDDVIRASWGADVVYGGAGRDLVYADLNDRGQVQAGTYDDYVDGGSEHDTLNGMAGNDTLLGGTGDDELYGDDNVVYTQRPEGTDYLDGGDGHDRLYAGLEDEALVAAAGAAGR